MTDLAELRGLQERLREPWDQRQSRRILFEQQAADAIATLIARIGALTAGIDDTISTIAAVRATATTDEWAESADHFYTVCGETLIRARSLLAEKG